MNFYPLLMPDIEIKPECRAEKSRRVVTDEFAVCLTDNPACEYQVDVDGLRLCFHPCRNKIIDRSSATVAEPQPNQNQKIRAASFA